jgi:hypothetical protein
MSSPVTCPSGPVSAAAVKARRRHRITGRAPACPGAARRGQNGAQRRRDRQARPTTPRRRAFKHLNLANDPRQCIRG